MSSRTTLLQVFSRNMSKARIRRKLSQRSLADATGLARSYISLLESGERDPRVSTLEALSKVMRVRAADLLRT